MPSALSTNRLINVTVNLSPSGAQMQNTSTLLILGSSAVIDVAERYRSYNSIAAVASDFGTSAAEYLAAVAYFSQTPKPVTLQIGRWAKTATNGVLKCGSLSAAQQLMTAWTSITTGGFKISVDGTLKTLTALNFSGAANLNAVAALIQAALVAAGAAGATVVWNAVYSRFEMTSGTTGAASTMSALTAPGSGVDISAQLAGTAPLLTSTVGGITAETAVAAAAIFDDAFGQLWYALTFLGAVDADHLAVAALIEASANRHAYGVSTQDPNAAVGVATSDIAYQLKALGYKHTTVQYSSTSPYAVCSLLGRILTTDYQANNTVITLMYKQEPGVAAETLTATQADALAAKNCNVFVNYNNSTAIIQNGVASSGDFLDLVVGTDWLALSIQNAVYNALYTSDTKIPQTDAGTQVLVTTVAAECTRAVNNGLLAPGVWQSAGFGGIKQNDFLPTGFYVYAPPIATQSAGPRALRRSVPIQVAAKMAGAIHAVDVAITVNR